MLAKTFYHIAIGMVLLTTESGAQENAAEQNLIRVGYQLSAESARFEDLRENIAEIKRKKIALGQENSREMCHITMLITNIFWVETICSYESLLLSSLQSIPNESKLEHYQLLHSRLKNNTLKNMYLNFKSTQSNFARIGDKEILNLSDNVKMEMLKVLKLIEEEIDMLERQFGSSH